MNTFKSSTILGAMLLSIAMAFAATTANAQEKFQFTIRVPLQISNLDESVTKIWVNLQLFDAHRVLLFETHEEVSVNPDGSPSLTPAVFRINLPNNTDPDRVDYALIKLRLMGANGLIGEPGREYTGTDNALRVNKTMPFIGDVSVNMKPNDPNCDQATMRCL